LELLRGLSRLPVQVVPRAKWDCCISNRSNDFCRTLQGARIAPCLSYHAGLRIDAARRGQVVCDVCPCDFLHLAAPLVAGGEAVAVLEVGWPLAEVPDGRTVARVIGKLNGNLPERKRAALKRYHRRCPELDTVQCERVAGLVGLVAATLGPAVMQQRLAGTGAVPAMVRDAKELAIRRFREPLTVAGVAERLRVSSDHFTRVFRRHEGCGFIQYLMKVRVSEACRLLWKTGLTISEIAYACGFNAVPHFNRIFRRVSGTTPSAYRQCVPVFVRRCKAAVAKPTGRKKVLRKQPARRQ
jgi:AraC-like DNA-binding protein